MARSADEVRTMMSEANRIYEQIGVSFYIDSISYTNRKDWLDLRISPGYDDRCNLIIRREMVDVTKNSNGLEFYFVNCISKSSAANADMFGIVVSTNASAKGLAHEIGHAFGCSDIYHAKKIQGQIITLPDRMAYKEHAEYDWNNGSGCRYYPRSVTQDQLIASLLMCGYQYPQIGDLSYGSVYGFARNDDIPGMVDVGFFRGSVRRSIQLHR